MKYVLSLVALIVLVGCGASSSQQQTAQPSRLNGEESIESWQQSHPEAAKELGDWVQRHPDAAAIFFDWDGHHPVHAHEFVTWTIQHPGQGIDHFVVAHPKWEYFDTISEQHRPAAEDFMSWIHRHNQAAERLMSHEHGLEWAGHHLFQAYWHVEGH
jgi:hypothetical protein